MTKLDCFYKRLFDVFSSCVGLFVFFPFILLAWIIASIETRSNGFFIQKRIGKHGKFIHVFKIKTMYNSTITRSSITADVTKSITKSGLFLRKYKIDELPQLLNVLMGQMSFVGPRPDVSGYADVLVGPDRVILDVRPGITGPASLKYKNEEELLSKMSDAKKYNDEVIWPDKVTINTKYINEYSFLKDLSYIYKTVVK